MAKITGVIARRQANYTKEMLDTLTSLHSEMFKYFARYSFIKPGVLASTLSTNVLLPSVSSSGGDQIIIEVSTGSGVNSYGELIEVDTNGLTATYAIADVLNKTLFLKYYTESSSDLQTYDSHHVAQDASTVKSQDTDHVLFWRDYTPSSDSDVTDYPSSIPIGKLVFSNGAYSFDTTNGHRRLALATIPVVGTGLYADEFTPSITFPTSIQNFLACSGHQSSRSTTNPFAMSTTDLGKLLNTFSYMILQSGIPTYFNPGETRKDWFLTTDTGSGSISVGSTGEYLIDNQGRLLELSGPQVFTLASGETKYIVHRYTESSGKDSAETVALNVEPSDRGTYLSKVVYTGGSACSITDKRQQLIMRCFLPKMEKEKPGTNNEIEDVVVNRTIPMPIILSIESDVPETYGVTEAAVSSVPRALTTLQGTPLGTLRVWIGDIVTGSRNSSNHKKIEFDMSTSRAGVGAHPVNGWINDPPGYYYIVNEAETWYSKITSNGEDYVIAEDDYPDDSNTTFYICPYAKSYVGKATPYETTHIGTYSYTPHPWGLVPQPPAESNPITPIKKLVKYSNTISVGSSPVEPVVVIEGTSLASRYKVEVASVISSETNTAWATCDFIVGYDIRTNNCWDVSAEYVALNSTVNGVRGIIPDKGAETIPDYWELTYTVGDENGSVPDTPDPMDTTHEHMQVYGRNFTINAPPGRVVKVAAQGIYKRLTMRECVNDSVATKIVYGQDSDGNTFAAAGGTNIYINDKQYNTRASITALASGSEKLCGRGPITNAITTKRIHLFNNDDSSKTNFRVWVHEASADADTGQNIQIGGQGGDETTLGANSDVEKDLKLSLYDRIAVTVENFASGPLSCDLDISVVYSEI